MQPFWIWILVAYLVIGSHFAAFLAGSLSEEPAPADTRVGRFGIWVFAMALATAAWPFILYAHLRYDD